MQLVDLTINNPPERHCFQQHYELFYRVVEGSTGDIDKKMLRFENHVLSLGEGPTIPQIVEMF